MWTKILSVTFAQLHGSMTQLIVSPSTRSSLSTLSPSPHPSMSQAMQACQSSCTCKKFFLLLSYCFKLNDKLTLLRREISSTKECTIRFLIKKEIIKVIML